ncbi:YitT family protein [Sediminibacterium soli]|uniref:YitT family protein n=1 Tax=Sediminibacterium soli TaxID=2698829 RepID=UPI00137A0A19|nr:YitT family protein [Sediminibacterium soli]NCI45993.1 YitT family protein [Sediminibacterium soli]
MRGFLQKIITELILKDKNAQKNEVYSDYALAKGFRELKITLSRGLKDIFLVTLGIASAAFGLEGFLLPNNFIDGGATGISLLISETAKIPLYFLIPLVNIPFMFLAIKVVGRSFAIKTALAITGLAICVASFHFPEVTHDRLLVAVFGGFFLGAGIGLAVRGGAVIDGTEVLAIFLSRKFGTTIGDIIVIINVIVFSTAAYLFSLEMALYSMITYLCASKTLDFIIEGIDEYTGVTIVSTHSDEIREMITTVLGRGITVYRGKRGYGTSGEKKDIDILYTVITRLELNKLKVEILKIDPHAFVVMNSVKDTKGGMIKKRALKH